MGIRFRDRGDDRDLVDETTQDITARVGYNHMGDLLTWSLDFVYYGTTPLEYGEQRYGGRLWAELTPTAFFALGGYFEYQVQDQDSDATPEDQDLILMGLYGRVLF